jgi:hypothetical protein
MNGGDFWLAETRMKALCAVSLAYALNPADVDVNRSFSTRHDFSSCTSFMFITCNLYNASLCGKCMLSMLCYVCYLLKL